MSECEDDSNTYGGGVPTRRKYPGLYRGTVLNNVDPMQRGRLMLQIPDALSFSPSTWAEPCVPLAGPTGPPMGVYMVPAIGTGVWVQFEHGDIDKPVWIGCRWGLPSDIPTLAKAGKIPQEKRRARIGSGVTASAGERINDDKAIAVATENR